MTPKELQHKRERGLCFRCDEKWAIGHRCKQKELSVLLTQEEEDELEAGEEGLTVVTGEEQTLTPEVSLNSVVGLSSPKTLRLRGIIAGEEVIVMIDHGATHNFMPLALIKKIKIANGENKRI